MSPERQRIVIAEACGWTYIHRRNIYGQRTEFGTRLYGKNEDSFSVTSDGESPYEPIPDYINDLNAMHEAEKTLNEKLNVWYLQKLTQVRYREGVSGMIGCMIDKTTFATAKQRAEAFLRTIGKWEDAS